MKTINEIQEENRKLILETISDGNTNRYLEKLATEKLLDSSDGPFGYGQWVSIFEGVLYKSYPDINDDFVENHYLMTIEDFAKSLLTLSRVLLALGKVDCGSFFISDRLVSFITAGDDYGKTYSFEWNLQKETLEEQEEEVQRQLNQLLQK